MFSYALSLICTIIIVSCTSAALVVTVVSGAGTSHQSAYTLEFPGVKCSDLAKYFAKWSDPKHVCKK